LLDRTTQSAAELIVSKCCLCVRLWIEKVACVEFVISEELEERTVKIIRADFVTMFTMAPELRPYSDSKFESIAASEIASIGRMVAGVPNTRLR
jgi:hypothetical protein